MPGPEITLGTLAFCQQVTKCGVLLKEIRDDPCILRPIGQPVPSDLGDLLGDWTAVMTLLGGTPV